MSSLAAAREAELRPEIDRRRTTADALATAVRECHQEALQAQEDGDGARAATLMAKVEQLNKQCNHANRTWLQLVIQVMNAKRDGAGGAGV